jgi:hypothetical protein
LSSMDTEILQGFSFEDKEKIQEEIRKMRAIE